MIIKGKITILVNPDSVEIQLMDRDASVTFATVTLTPEQFCTALGRLAHMGCDIDIVGLEKVGKKMEYKSCVFELPDGYTKNYKSSYDDTLRDFAQNELDLENEGWIADSFFGSQNSFFEKDGKKYARCTVRRWV